MRKLLAPMITVLALATMPAVAQTPPPEPTPPCPTSDQFLTLGNGAGKHETFSPQPTPSFPYDLINDNVQPTSYREESVTRFRYRIDVSGSATKPFAKTANVNLTLSWDNDTDFDLFVYDKDGGALGESVSFNPLDGAGENVTLTAVAQCTDIRIDVVNYLGAPTSALVLDGKLANLKP
jgi:hypothetical protein